MKKQKRKKSRSVVCLCLFMSVKTPLKRPMLHERHPINSKGIPQIKTVKTVFFKPLVTWSIAYTLIICLFIIKFFTRKYHSLPWHFIGRADIQYHLTHLLLSKLLLCLSCYQQYSWSIDIVWCISIFWAFK